LPGAARRARRHIFIATDQKAARHNALNGESPLPELGRAGHFGAAALIEYLTWLQASR